MPVSTPHPQYDAELRRWERCRDVTAGADAIKARGTRYLPALPRLLERDNAEYRLRAPWNGVMRRTIVGLLGCLFRVPPTYDGLPQQMEDELSDITLTGVSFEALLRQLFTDVLTVGRAGIRLDMPPLGADRQRVYWRPLKAEQILNWRVENVGGAQVLTRVIIHEVIMAPDPTDVFVDRKVDQISVIELIDGGVHVSRYQAPNEEVSLSAQSLLPRAFTPIDDEPIPLVRRGEVMRIIPVVIVNATMTGPDVESPPLLDMADLSINLYQAQADYAWGSHKTALATPVFYGVMKGNEGPPPLGPGGALFLPADAKAEFLEVRAGNLDTLQVKIDQYTAQLAALGGRLIETPRRSAETAESVRLKSGTDLSLLSAMAGTFEASVTTAVRLHAWWEGLTDDPRDESITVSMNRDYLDAKLSADEMRALVASWRAGAITTDLLLQNLRDGEVIPQSANIEEVAATVEGARQPPAPEPQPDPELTIGSV